MTNCKTAGEGSLDYIDIKAKKLTELDLSGELPKTIHVNSDNAELNCTIGSGCYTILDLSRSSVQNVGIYSGLFPDSQIQTIQVIPSTKQINFDFHGLTRGGDTSTVLVGIGKYLKITANFSAQKIDSYLYHNIIYRSDISVENFTPYKIKYQQCCPAGNMYNQIVYWEVGLET